MLDLASLPEEPVVICLQALGRPVFGECPKACLVSQMSKCKSRLACFCRTPQMLTGKTYNKKTLFNSFLWSNKILAFSDSVKKCWIFFTPLVYVHRCYLPTRSPDSYDASWAMISAWRNSVYLVPKATSSTSAASSVQSPTSRYYRSVSAPKSEESACAEGMFKLVSTKLAWCLTATQLQQRRAGARNNLSFFWPNTLLQCLNEERIQSVLHFE